MATLNCPVCDEPHQPNDLLCMNCGANLARGGGAPRQGPGGYDDQQPPRMSPPPGPGQYGGPQHGQPQYGQPQQSHDPYGQQGPQHQQPGPSGQPQDPWGAPQQQPDAWGAPLPQGQDQHGQPQHGQYGQPQHGGPQHGQPQQGQPHGQPQHGQPQHGGQPPMQQQQPADPWGMPQPSQDQWGAPQQQQSPAPDQYQPPQDQYQPREPQQYQPHDQYQPQDQYGGAPQDQYQPPQDQYGAPQPGPADHQFGPPPQHGQIPHGGPQHGGPPHGGPQHGAPQHGAPQHGGQPPLPPHGREATLLPPDHNQGQRPAPDSTAFMCPYCEAVLSHPGAAQCDSCLRPLPKQGTPVLRVQFPTGELKVSVGQHLVLGRDAGQSPVASTFTQYDNVSRRHSTVWLDPSGTAWVRDEGSTNGTFVNGERLPRGVEAPLRNGDQLRLAADVTGTVQLK